MATSAKPDRLDVRLSSELKQSIEQAAACLGQSVSDFVTGTMTRRAREVIREAHAVELSNRDRDRFLTALDDVAAKPNAALLRAAERHKAAGG